MTHAHVRELPDVRLGLRENAAQFSLLVGLNGLWVSATRWTPKRGLA
jgi:hypothetical protein